MLTKDRSQRGALRFLRYTHALFKGLASLFLLLVLTSGFIFTVFKVDGHSMDATLRNGQVLPVYLGYRWFGTPKRGEIVIVSLPVARDEYIVKRVIGVPGDTMPYKDAFIVLKSNEYFVAGDNREQSNDSRTFGPIDRSRIVGKVLGNFAEGPASLR